MKTTLHKTYLNNYQPLRNGKVYQINNMTKAKILMQIKVRLVVLTFLKKLNKNR